MMATIHVCGALMVEQAAALYFGMVRYVFCG